MTTVFFVESKTKNKYKKYFGKRKSTLTIFGERAIHGPSALFSSALAPLFVVQFFLSMKLEHQPLKAYVLR